jgi:hypothetical protein
MSRLEFHRLSKRGRNSPTKQELLAENARLRKHIEVLEATVADLKEQLTALRKKSSTSSKLPSNDIVNLRKPPAADGARKRKRGGQPGHPKHERPPFPPEMVDEVHEYRLEVCPDCACADLIPSASDPRTLQQADAVWEPLRLRIPRRCRQRALPRSDPSFAATRRPVNAYKT